MLDDGFRARLLPGEHIVWAGQPAGGLLFTRRDTFLIPFSLLWCGFVIFWTIGASSMGAPGPFILWSATFLLIGLYFLLGRFAVDAWFRRRIDYAVTDRRILIVRAPPFGKFTAINLAQLCDVDLVERPNGRGTIRFGRQEAVWPNRGWAGWSPSLDPVPQFLAIDDVRRVFDLIQRTSQKGLASRFEP